MYNYARIINVDDRTCDNAYRIAVGTIREIMPVCEIVIDKIHETQLITYKICVV